MNYYQDGFVSNKLFRIYEEITKHVGTLIDKQKTQTVPSKHKLRPF